MPDDHAINVLQWNILAQGKCKKRGLDEERLPSDRSPSFILSWGQLCSCQKWNGSLWNAQVANTGTNPHPSAWSVFIGRNGHLRLFSQGTATTLRVWLTKGDRSLTHVYLSRYTCFFTPKPNSRCLSFEGVSADFKGPDGTLLCYRNSLFQESKRENADLPNDGRHGRQVDHLALFRRTRNRSDLSLGVLCNRARIQTPIDSDRLHRYTLQGKEAVCLVSYATSRSFNQLYQSTVLERCQYYCSGRLQRRNGRTVLCSLLCRRFL